MQSTLCSNAWSQVPNRCYDRVKGLLFLDEHFKPTSHKTFIAPKDLFFGLLCRSGAAHSDFAQLKADFQSKMVEWHENFDDEEKYEGEGVVVDSNTLEWTRCRCSGASYAKGDRVTIKPLKGERRKKIYGTIVAFATRVSDGVDPASGSVLLAEVGSGERLKYDTRQIGALSAASVRKSGDRIKCSRTKCSQCMRCYFLGRVSIRESHYNCEC